MKCPECGEENRDGALMCELCQSVLVPSAASRARAQPAKAQPTRPPPASQPAPPSPPSSPSRISHAPGTFVLPQTARPANVARSRWLLGFVVLGAVASVLLWYGILRRKPVDHAKPPAPLAASAPAIAVDNDADLAGDRMVGLTGEDAYGYPVNEPNQLRLRAMLRHRRFTDLDSELKDYQRQLEADFHKENWVAVALAAFSIEEPALETPLDEWVKASPSSFAAYAARAAYALRLGWVARGTQYAKDTPPERFREMERHHARARADYEKAIALRPKLVAAYQGLIRIGSAGSAPDRLMARWLSRALSVCRDCFYVRTVYLRGLQPRWGGSYEDMSRFAAEAAQESSNPRLRVLAGFVAEDQCQVASADDNASALSLCDQAISQGDSAPFFALRGRVRGNLKDTAGAIADYDRALGISPQNAQAMARRGTKLAESKEWDRAERDLLLAHRLDPYDDGYEKRIKYLVESLVYEGTQQEKANSPGDAKKLYQQALRLAPAHPAARAFLARVQNLPPLLAPPQPADTFEAHKAADDTLVRYGRFQTIVEMWDGFIARHPDEARAYLERGGARANLGQGSAAIADMAKACELGLPKGCEVREILKRRFRQNQ